MELFGSDFGSGDTLTFFDPQGTSHASGAAKLTVVSSTEMEYQFNDGGDPGTWTVEVNSPDGTLHWFYSFAVAAPSLSSVSPTSYPASTSSQMMVLLGCDFASGDTLTFFDPQGTSHASGAAKLTVVSSTEIKYQFNDGSDPGTWTCLSIVRTGCSIPIAIHQRGAAIAGAAFRRSRSRQAPAARQWSSSAAIRKRRHVDLF